VKPKAKTQIERMGFKDNDLKTSKHDKIMFWLDNYIRTDFIKVLKETRYPKFMKYYHKPEINIGHIKWEKPIKTESGYNIGFIDLYLGINLTYYKLKVNKYTRKKTYENDSDYHDYYFEVKSKLPSIGELIRQVNFYKSNLGYKDRGEFYVVAPKTTNKIINLLKQQGINFIEYPEKPKKKNILENIVRRDSE